MTLNCRADTNAADAADADVAAAVRSGGGRQLSAC